jgi:hypothetical protein
VQHQHVVEERVARRERQGQRALGREAAAGAEARASPRGVGIAPAIRAGQGPQAVAGIARVEVDVDVEDRALRITLIRAAIAVPLDRGSIAAPAPGSLKTMLSQVGTKSGPCSASTARSTKGWASSARQAGALSATYSTRKGTSAPLRGWRLYW